MSVHYSTSQNILQNFHGEISLITHTSLAKDVPCSQIHERQTRSHKPRHWHITRHQLPRVFVFTRRIDGRYPHRYHSHRSPCLNLERMHCSTQLSGTKTFRAMSSIDGTLPHLVTSSPIHQCPCHIFCPPLVHRRSPYQVQPVSIIQSTLRHSRILSHMLLS